MSERFWGFVVKNAAVVRLFLSLLLVVAVLLVCVPAAHAEVVLVPGDGDTYTSADQFVPDSDSRKPDKAYLTVTKLLSKRDGTAAVGSDKDASVLKNPNVGVQFSGVGVEFMVTRVTPKAGVSSGDMDPKLSNFDTHERYVGKTDGNGVIKNAPNASVSSASDGFWRVVDNGGVVTQFPVVDNAGVVNYYLLREMDSPYSRADNPLYD
ncbi:hypothetical protein, partial [Bombiscardovia coagulans]